MMDMHKEQNASYNKTLRKGFSLIEIVVVIAIIGVLAAGAFGGLRMLQRVKTSTTRTKLASLRATLEQYHTDIGEYPTDLRELVEGPQKPQLRKRWSGPLASEDELKDAWGKEVVYSLNAKGDPEGPYKLISTGPKGDTEIFAAGSED